MNKNFRKSFPLSSIIFIILIQKSCVTPISAGATGGSSVSETIEEFVERQVNEDFLPKSKAVGLGLTVVDLKNNLVYSKGFGLRDVAANSFVTTKTLFPIGSNTKSFVSTMIIKILNEMFPDIGENVVEMPIQKLLKMKGLDFNVTLSDRYRSESVSFRDLLSHRICLTSHLTGAMFGAVANFEEYVYRSRYNTEICPFRSAYNYNNAMYALAGDLISKLSGDTFVNLMRNFLDDLQMTDSHLVNHEDDYETLPNMVQGYYVDENGDLQRNHGKLLSQVASAAPAGALLSTADDMAKYMQFHINRGKVGDRQVVPEAVMNWLHRPAIPIDNGVSYGMGFRVLPLVGQELPMILHNGFWPPFASTMTIIPGLQLAIFTSTAGPGATTPGTAQSELHDQILAFILAGAGMKIPNPFNLSGKEDNIEIKQSSKNEQVFSHHKKVSNCSDSEILGTFGNSGDGDFEISLDTEANLVKIKYGSMGEGILTRILEPAEGCKFKIEWTSPIKGVFYTYSDGLEIANNLEFSENFEMALYEFEVGGISTFQRNLNLVDLPEIPYDPESCGTTIIDDVA